MSRKNSTFHGYETAKTSAWMTVKMHLQIFIFILFLHAAISIGWTSYSNWTDIVWFKDYVRHSTGLFSMPDTNYLSLYLKAFARESYELAISIWPIWIAYPIILGFFARRAKKQGGIHHIRGAKLLEEKEIVRGIKREKWHRDSRIRIGSVPIPKKEEVKHWFIVGRPGVGKTVAISSAIEQLMASGARGVIYDFKGDYASRFYRPDRDLIFNPLDARSIQWNILDEAKTIMDVGGISACLIPEGVGESVFWNAGARDIFNAILHYCLANGKRTNRDIWETACLPLDGLAEILKNTPRGARGYALIQQKDKMAGNFRTNMMVYVGGLEYMSESAGGFTIRKWVDTDRQGFIFVTNYSKIKDVLRPLLSLFIDLLSRELLSLRDNYDRRVFFMLDEFGTLQNLNSITGLLTQSRSKGGSVWIGIQDQGQIEKIYGKEGRQSIVSSCGGNLIFSVADPDTSEYLSKKIGDCEFYETETSHSMGPGDDRDGLSLAKRRQTGRLILPSQIQNLKDLNFYLKVPGLDVAQTRLQYKKYEDVNEPFILREGLDMSEIFKKQKEMERAIDALFLPRGKSHDASNGWN